uniref:Uncharacterized protein n=1 Tax=Cacopsylla melanoneura TaxID=428564 RepID=A0A8D8VL03_9HEMI
MFSVNNSHATVIQVESHAMAMCQIFWQMTKLWSWGSKVKIKGLNPPGLIKFMGPTLIFNNFQFFFFLQILEVLTICLFTPEAQVFSETYQSLRQGFIEGSRNKYKVWIWRVERIL